MSYCGTVLTGEQGNIKKITLLEDLAGIAIVPALMAN